MDDLIVVTVQSCEFSRDYELPWNLPLGELYPRMLEILKTAKPGVFSRYKGIVFSKGGKGMLSMDATLADYGIHTGSILTVKDEVEFYG